MPLSTAIQWCRSLCSDVPVPRRSLPRPQPVNVSSCEIGHSIQPGIRNLSAAHGRDDGLRFDLKAGGKLRLRFKIKRAD